jgi:hypothetical protein
MSTIEESAVSRLLWTESVNWSDWHGHLATRPVQLRLTVSHAGMSHRTEARIHTKPGPDVSECQDSFKQIEQECHYTAKSIRKFWLILIDKMKHWLDVNIFNAEFVFGDWDMVEVDELNINFVPIDLLWRHFREYARQRHINPPLLIIICALNLCLISLIDFFVIRWKSVE